MMKKFEMPAMDVETLDVVDVITTSGSTTDCVTDGCPNDAGEF